MAKQKLDTFEAQVASASGVRYPSLEAPRVSVKTAVAVFAVVVAAVVLFTILHR